MMIHNSMQIVISKQLRQSSQTLMCDFWGPGSKSFPTLHTKLDSENNLTQPSTGVSL